MASKDFENNFISPLEFSQNEDDLRLFFVKERAGSYRLDIPVKFQLIEEMTELLRSARRSYLENISKSKANH